MPKRIALKNTIKKIEKRQRRAKKNRRLAHPISHDHPEGVLSSESLEQQIGPFQVQVQPLALPIPLLRVNSNDVGSVHLASSVFPEHSDIVAPSAEQSTLYQLGSLFSISEKEVEEDSVHLGSSIFPTKTDLQCSAEVPSIHLASSVFPTESAEPLDLNALQTQKKIITKKSHSVEMIKAKPIPARRFSLSSEPIKADGSLNALGRLSLSIQRNKAVLDQVLRNKDQLQKSEGSETCYCNLTSLIHSNRDRPCLDEISRQPARVNDSCTLHRSTFVSSTVNSDSSFTLSGSLSSWTHLGTSVGTQTSLEDLTVSERPSHRTLNMRPDGIRGIALDCTDVGEFIHQLGKATSVSAYFLMLENVCGDYLKLIKTVYLPRQNKH